MKKYKIIYADPPWSYTDNFQCNAKYGGITYPTMSTEEICDLPISDLADSNAILFLWGTWPNISSALQVIKAWGFEYKTVGFVWVKISAGKPRTGIGNYTNSNTEFCLIGKKGKISRIKNNVSQIIMENIREHSRKPDTARKRIVDLMGDLPRIELFSRQKFEGWDAWGNEVPKEEQKILLKG